MAEEYKPFMVCKCSACESGPCYMAIKGKENPDPYVQTYYNELPMYCPSEESDYSQAKWRWIKRPLDGRYMKTKWMVDDLPDWVGQHWDELPKWAQDASCGLIAVPQRTRYLREIRLLNLLQNIDDGYIDREEAQKEIANVTKLEILNEAIPAAFEAGMMYAAKLVLENGFVPNPYEDEEDNEY